MLIFIFFQHHARSLISINFHEPEIVYFFKNNHTYFEDVLLTELPDIKAISLSLVKTDGIVRLGGANIVLWVLLLFCVYWK